MFNVCCFSFCLGGKKQQVIQTGSLRCIMTAGAVVSFSIDACI